MNIKKAAVQIKNAMRVYFMKDETGEYIVPMEKQRPIFLVGAPGIGKTAIMEQIAKDLGVGLVTYSMTHHTRQSALGLPFIVKHDFGGKEYSVTEYTMSEIIGSVYRYMEKTGVKEGILFLDEINCVSETLAPAMLEFLQYKVFGTHSVPQGWIIVTAGNPPEFNRSVREFDIATLDRLKKISIEPDYKVWKEYAIAKGVHPAVISYLDIKNEDFYKIETTPSGKNYITARGWEDLSQMLIMYEKADIEVDLELCEQYIAHKQVAGDFADSYFLYRRYKVEFAPEKIIHNEYDDALIKKAKELSSDDRRTLVSILIEEVGRIIKQTQLQMDICTEAVKIIKALPSHMRDAKSIKEKGDELLSQAQIKKEQKLISASEYKKQAMIASKLLDISKECGEKDLMSVIKEIGATVSIAAGNASTALSNTIRFIEAAFSKGMEMDYFTTALNENAAVSEFLRSVSNADFINHQTDLSGEIDKMIAVEFS